MGNKRSPYYGTFDNEFKIEVILIIFENVKDVFRDDKCINLEGPLTTAQNAKVKICI